MGRVYGIEAKDYAGVEVERQISCNRTSAKASTHKYIKNRIKIVSNLLGPKIGSLS